MIRETRGKQGRRLATRRRSSSTRRRSGSGRSTREGVGRRLALGVNSKTSAKTASQSLQKAEAVEHGIALKNFESAVRFFQRKDYEKAGALFEKLAAAPIREIAHRARVHLRLCEMRQHQEIRPKTAEGYYARGVAALNSQDFDRAIQFLARSDEMIPNQEYVHYALAAAYSLRGDSDKAISHLERAIGLRPQNRVQARQDEDFQVLASDPRFTRLLGTNG